MLRAIFFGLVFVVFATGRAKASRDNDWIITSTDDWKRAERESDGLVFESGFARPISRYSYYRSIVRTFKKKRSAKVIVFKQSPVWHNWDTINNICPCNLRDAPVTLAVGPGNYWIFGLYEAAKKGSFKPEEARLEGFDKPLWTSPFPNQYNARGGLNMSLGGYHAWQSRDMVNWVHHGPVTEGFSRWVTTAEYVNGKAYIYYDFPNDQDPHLYIDDDLTDGKPGRNVGLVFKDPSDGSDCAVIRDLTGRFHLIYEDWSPINARKHSWDSPLAGHAVSDDGMGDFQILPPAVDQRTKPTGEHGHYLHPHWCKEDPMNFPSNIARYEVHTPEQNAYGDWAAISVGGQYYLFGDFHPAHDKIRVGWFTSASFDEHFSFCGAIGQEHGHPDPDIIFAEGKFYLVTQTPANYVSSGPWVKKIETRVGIDTDGDNAIEKWTDWQEVKETYEHIEGFVKQIKRIPALIDLSDMPAGFGFCFEFRTEDTTKNESKPILDSVRLSFDKNYEVDH